MRRFVNSSYVQAEGLRVDAADLFKTSPVDYKAYDESGFPTMGADGEALSKGATKKCQKTLKNHLAKQQKVLKKSGEATIDDYIAKLAAELEALAIE